MKARTMLICAGFSLGLLGYKLLVPAPVETKPMDPIPASTQDADESSELQRAAVEDLEPKATAEKADEVTATEVNSSPEPKVESQELESQRNDVPSDSTIIKVKTPIEYESRTPVVSLIQSDQDVSGPDREQLANVTQSFEEGRDAVVALGDQLNALNGTYLGELGREGKEACSLNLTIDGSYVAAEGQKGADFSGSFVMGVECPNGMNSKRLFDKDFGAHARVIGDVSKTLLLKDPGGVFFQLSFSRDFQRVMGHAYDSSSGSPVYLGKLIAQR